MRELTIFVVSDGTGETADQMIKAALVQYGHHQTRMVRYKNICSESQLSSILEEAVRRQAIVVYTVVTPKLKDFLARMTIQTGVLSVDLLGPLMDRLGDFLQEDPKAKAGLFHEVNEGYFRRIEAIEYTVKHDDGKHTQSFEEADIVLVGLSRTSKTPLSIYLSYKGWRVANVPVVTGVPLPDALFRTDQRKIVGLIIDPQALVQIRRERLAKMGDHPESSYASYDHVIEELEYCKAIYRRNRMWPVFDVTGKALEETAAEVEKAIVTASPERHAEALSIYAF